MSKVKDWIEDKVAATKDAAYVKAYQAKMWAKEHPEEAATIITTAIGAMVIIGRRIDKGVRLKNEMKLKDRYIYDRSLGRYWTLKRKPTQNEALRIESMRKAGLSYGDILTRMKLL